MVSVAINRGLSLSQEQRRAAEPNGALVAPDGKAVLKEVRAYLDEGRLATNPGDLIERCLQVVEAASKGAEVNAHLGYIVHGASQVLDNAEKSGLWFEPESIEAYRTQIGAASLKALSTAVESERTGFLVNALPKSSTGYTAPGLQGGGM